MIMEFGSLICDQLSEVQVVACNLCALDSPTNPVVTACGHCFCWPCLYKFLQGQAKPCPVCITMLSSDVNVTPVFDTHGALVLCLPIAEEVEHSWDDDMPDWSGTAAFAAAAAARSEDESSVRRDLDMAAVVVLDEETKFKGNGIGV